VAMGVIEFSTSAEEAPSKLGIEGVGIVRDIGPGVRGVKVGQRVFTMMSHGCFATRLTISEEYCAPIPDRLSDEGAATMPCVFATAIYGLLDVGRLSADQTVLIHSACGGVGLAAIQIAQMIGAEIYCTVSTEEKIIFLETNFGIRRDHIFNSRDDSFLAGVLAATNNRGADLVLNSLSGELLHTSWRCVAEFGKLIEIGKRDLVGNGSLDLRPFLENRSYHGVDLSQFFEAKPAECHR
jgi:NADPH:quinone reductase-like Zn-dependent oxidoreductase